MAAALRADAWSPAEIRTKFPRSYTKRTDFFAGAQASGGIRHETGNLDRQHRPVRWYRRRALLFLHGTVERIAICDIDQRAAAVKARQRRRLRPPPGGSKEHAQRRLNEFRHCASLTYRFTPELRHDGAVDVESRLHMVNHIINMAIW